MTKHSEFEILIQKCLDREISVDENINLQMHLSQCPECMSLYNELLKVENGINALNQMVPNHDFNNRILKAIHAQKSKVWAKVGAICGGLWFATVIALFLSPLPGDIFKRVFSSTPSFIRFINNIQFAGSTLTRVFSPLAKTQFNPTVFVIGGILSIGTFFMFGKFLRKKEIIWTAQTK